MSSNLPTAASWIVLIFSFFILLYISETSLFISAVGSSDWVSTTLVKSEESSETLDYKRLDSEIRDLREVIQTLRASRVLKDSPKNNKKFEGKIKEVEILHF
jgi:hypothetical protein